MRRLYSTLALALMLYPAQAAAQTDTKDIKSYGNCEVFTTVDLFTDEERHYFACRKDNELFDLDTVAIGIGTTTKTEQQDEGLSPLGVLLTTGFQFHFGEKIPIKIRVDKGELIERSAIIYEENAALFDVDLASRLLHDLARGQRAIIHVGKKGGTINLDGSQRAIADFLQRAGLQPPNWGGPPQPTLTIEQRRATQP